MLKTRKNIVVCGTHGKTTTTSLAAFLLRENGRDPGFLIGGVPLDPPVGNHLGSVGDPFVIEGDEYDSAFFDKRSKFIHYAPHVGVLNNLEFDHADIFRDLADVQRTFSHFCRIVPRTGFVVLNGDDENIRALGELPWTQVVRVGTGEGNDVRITNFAETAAGVEFSLNWGDQLWGRVSWAMPGIYNARNAAMAATAAALATWPADQVAGVVPNTIERAAGKRLGDKPLHLSLESLARFRGVKRRQEVLVAKPGPTVIEDFGHHPTALAETLRSFRNRYPGTVITAVFEPRSNTARTNTLQAGFMAALALADEVYLGAVNRADKLKADERFDTDAVIAHVASQGGKGVSASTNAGLLEKLTAATLPAEAGRSRLVVFFSNGSFDGIIARYAAAAGGA